MDVTRVFLLSPANCSGIRGGLVSSADAAFPLARQLRSRDGAPVGEVFSFVSGLYFRGKLAYARRFASPPGTDPAGPLGGVFVITPSAGLLPPETCVTSAIFGLFARTPVDPENPAYAEPLTSSARAVAERVGPASDVVLLGSVASGKYVELLQPIFGERLLFPSEFVGRGDMSRGGLLLRSVAAGTELEYIPIAGAVRRGSRPPRLTPLTSSSTAARRRRRVLP